MATISRNVSYAQTDTITNYRKGLSFGFLGALNYPLFGSGEVTYVYTLNSSNYPYPYYFPVSGKNRYKFWCFTKTSFSRKIAFQTNLIYSIERFKIDFGNEMKVARLRSFNINPMIAINFTNNFSMMFGIIYSLRSDILFDILGLNLIARYLMNNGISIGFQQNYISSGNIQFYHNLNNNYTGIYGRVNSFHLIIGYHFSESDLIKMLKR